jgi:cytochrome c oxidase cbb3-type subunit 3
MNLNTGGILFVIALMAATILVVGDSFSLGEDYINDLTMLGALAVIAITVFVSLKYINQIKNDTATGELSDENWDGIGEYKNEIPSGWGIMYIITIVWMMWYWTIGYPTNAFSQIGQWNEEVLEYNAKFEEKWKNPDAATLEAMGQSLFLVQCSPCHGVDAEGIGGKAQNLVTWGKEDSIVNTILNGASGMGLAGGDMPPMAQLTPAQAKAVAAYVVEEFTPAATKYPNLVAEGKELYNGMGTCSGCHGVDGNGVAGTFPALTDLTTAVLANNGKKASIGIMPSFSGRLNETQMKALNSYIYTLGE